MSAHKFLFFIAVVMVVFACNNDKVVGGSGYPIEERTWLYDKGFNLDEADYEIMDMSRFHKKFYCDEYAPLIPELSNNSFGVWLKTNTGHWLVLAEPIKGKKYAIFYGYSVGVDEDGEEVHAHFVRVYSKKER